jgi:hypothetical protein
MSIDAGDVDLPEGIWGGIYLGAEFAEFIFDGGECDFRGVWAFYVWFLDGEFVVR